MDNTQQLNDLRSKILEELVPLAEHSNFDPEQRFNLLLASARLSSDPGKFTAAHEAALAIEDNSAKADALLDLLDAVDVAAGSVDYTEEQAAPEASEQPQEPAEQPAGDQ